MKKSTPKTKDTLSRAQLQEISGFFATLADPNRLAILHRLLDGPETVGELCSNLDIKQATCSKHLATLRSANLVSRKAQGTSAIYSVSHPGLAKLCETACKVLIESTAARARRLSG